MNVHYVFDIDGTLTPSRGQIHAKFLEFMKSFILDRRFVYFITGSDKPKTIQQIGPTLFNLATRVYNCSGNQVWEGDKLVWQNDIVYTKALEKELNNQLEQSLFPLRTGLHIEERVGLINFSVVGRNAKLAERKLYIEYDKKTNERLSIAKYLSQMFPEYNIQVAGQTGIDITMIGRDKSQFINGFDPSEDFIYFFGDSTESGGNDYPLVKVLYENKMGKSFKVTSYYDTWSYLNDHVNTLVLN